MPSHHGGSNLAVNMASILSRGRIKRPRSFSRSAVVLLALLFVLLRPVCDALAASGHSHGVGAPAQAHMQMDGGAASGHADDGICCSSVDGHALTVPGIPPLPAALPPALSAPAAAIFKTSAPVAQRPVLVARRDPAPPLPYHARSQRRLD